MRSRSWLLPALFSVTLVGAFWLASRFEGQSQAVEGSQTRAAGTASESSTLTAGDGDVGRLRRPALAPSAALNPPQASAPDPDAHLPGVLQGRVIDPDGEPLSDVVVERRLDDASSYNGLDFDSEQREARAVATTTADGEFQFDVPYRVTSLVTVRAPGRPDVERAGCYAGEDIEIVIPLGTALAGRVRLASGAPLGEARIRVFHGPDQDTIATARSDSSGRFVVDRLHPGAAGLQVVPVRHAMPRWIELELRADQTSEVEVEIEDGWTLAGQVRDSRTQAPIAGAEVSCWEFIGKTVLTDARGLFRLEGARARPGTLVARAAGFGRGEVAFGAPGEAYDIKLEAGISLAGRVVDPMGQPVGDARVSAAGLLVDDGLRRREWKSARSIPDGRFEIDDVRADQDLVLFVRASGRAATVFPSERATAGDLAVLVDDLVLPAGAVLEGRILNSAGFGVPNITVFLNGPAHVAVPNDIGVYVLQREASTDAAGRFRVAELAAGEWSARIVPAGGAVSTETLSLATGELRRGIEWRLAAGGELSGIVRGPDAEPVARAFVMLLPEAGRRRSRLTRQCDEHGTFEFDDVPDGLWVLHATSGRKADDLEAGDAPLLPVALRGVSADGRFVAIDLPRGDGWVAGVVVNAAGEAQAHALVSRDRGDGNLFDGVLADAHGHFRVRVPAEGTSRLRAWRTAPLDSSQASITRLELELNRRVQKLPGGGAGLDGVRAGASGLELRLAD